LPRLPEITAHIGETVASGGRQLDVGAVEAGAGEVVTRSSEHTDVADHAAELCTQVRHGGAISGGQELRGFFQAGGFEAKAS